MALLLSQNLTSGFPAGGLRGAATQRFSATHSKAELLHIKMFFTTQVGFEDLVEAAARLSKCTHVAFSFNFSNDET